MKFPITLAILSSVAALASASCTRMGYIYLNFYGYPDNSPPSGDTAYNCGGRNHVAGGTGTYSDPVTFASAEGEFNECEVVYIPYVEKYARYEDYCAQCTVDYASNIRHLAIWTGSSQADLNGGADQQACEAMLTPNHTTTIIRKPASTYPVDITPFYNRQTAVTQTPEAGMGPHSGPVGVGGEAEGGSGGSAPSNQGNCSSMNFNVTINININVNVGRRTGPEARRNSTLLERNQGSCSMNLYPDNDATKICSI